MFKSLLNMQVNPVPALFMHNKTIIGLIIHA